MQRRKRGESARVGGNGARWGAVEARQILDEWSASGESLQGFAQGRGLVPQRLAWWRKRLLGDGRRPVAGAAAVEAAPEFLPVVVRPVGPGPVAATVEIAGSVRVELRALDSASAAWVASLVKALGAAT
jgi:hypothetical protein